MSSRSRTVPAGRFKAECLSLLDDVALTGRPLVVTKRGRPVARVVPVERAKSGSLKGAIQIVGDIVGPIDVEWNATR